MFEAKRDGDGEVVRCKARLVAKGSTQVEGIDFQDVCTLVARYTTTCPVLSVSVTMKHV